LICETIILQIPEIKLASFNLDLQALIQDLRKFNGILSVHSSRTKSNKLYIEIWWDSENHLNHHFQSPEGELLQNFLYKNSEHTPVRSVELKESIGLNSCGG